MTWRVVNSLLVLRDQFNATFPGRSRASDGTIGDAAHQAESTSDHDPHTYAALGSTPVVCALDITHDPAHGVDTYAIADIMRRARDPRVGYIISNRRITGPNHGWQWDAYTGTSDPHTNHMHVSSVHTALADDTRPWDIQGDDMSSKSDAILAAWASGVKTASDGTFVAPVDWEVRREANETAVNARLAAIQATLAAQTQTIANLTSLLERAGNPDVAPLVEQIKTMTAQLGRLADVEAAQSAQIAALQAKLAAAAKAEADTLGAA